MKRKTILKIHITTTVLAVVLISAFFSSSLIAELNGSIVLIKSIKKWILCGAPFMLVIMPFLVLSGNKLAKNSKAPTVLVKQKRVKFIAFNGVLLFLLALFLFYQSHYKSINQYFLIAQIIELVLGAINLSLLILNSLSGFKLSGRFNR